ncbi:Lactonase, 7-bladed beta-propeller-domain-containing protein [Tirmania nivea]|nr:Lactonase, 7-bladed beta-propeller-domain-containing protein [Tirmania nivea]
MTIFSLSMVPVLQLIQSTAYIIPTVYPSQVLRVRPLTFPYDHIIMTASTFENSRILLTGTTNSGIITLHSFLPKTQKFNLVSHISSSAPAPSWLRASRDKQKLYVVTAGTEEEGGGINIYKLEDLSRGSGAKLGSVASGWEPVSLDDVGRVLISAAYSGHRIDIYTIHEGTPFISGPNQSITYTIPAPGHNLGRQESSHPHQVLIDPTGHFLTVPDLGADLVRIYRIDQKSCTVVPMSVPHGIGTEAGIPGHVRVDDGMEGMVVPGDLETPSGMGPRHGIFYRAREKNSTEADYYFLVGELSNDVAVYECIYHRSQTIQSDDFKYDWLEFRLRQIISIYTKIGKVPANATAAEIAISYSTNTLYVSNRGDNTFSAQASDSISTFDINPRGGENVLCCKDMYPCGGRGPRHFDLCAGLLGEADEEFVTVACEGSSEVVVWKVEGWKEVARIKAGEERMGEGPAWVGWL